MNKKLIFIFLLLIFLFHFFKSFAENNTYINSKNIFYDEKNNIVELSENSKINTQNMNLLVDKGIIDYNKETFEVYGNFYLYQDTNILSGKDLSGNTNLDEFSAIEVSYLTSDDLKIDSAILDKKGDNLYFYDNFLTPCKINGYFNCPTWSLRIDKTKYDTIGDQFFHYDTFLQIADYKVFYLPYFSIMGQKHQGPEVF